MNIPKQSHVAIHPPRQNFEIQQCPDFERLFWCFLKYGPETRRKGGTCFQHPLLVTPLVPAFRIPVSTQVHLFLTVTYLLLQTSILHSGG